LLSGIHFEYEEKSCLKRWKNIACWHLMKKVWKEYIYLGGKGERIIKVFNLIKAQYIHEWNAMVKFLWIMNRCLKNERVECKSCPVRGWVLLEGRVVNGVDGGEWIWLMYFIYFYENRMMKVVEIILSRGNVVAGEWRRGWI
jgi:hypothetical protein